MAKKISGAKTSGEVGSSRCDDRTPQCGVPTKLKPSSLLDTRVIYCGDNLEQLAKLPDTCVDLVYMAPPFNSNRNHGQRPDWHSLGRDQGEARL